MEGGRPLPVRGCELLRTHMTYAGTGSHSIWPLPLLGDMLSTAGAPIPHLPRPQEPPARRQEGPAPPPHTQHCLSSRGLSGLGWVLDSLSHVLDRVFFQGQDIFQVIVPTETRWGGKERPAGDSSGAGPAPSEPATQTPCLRGRHCAPPPPLPQPLGHCPECRQQLIKNRTVE